MITKPNTSSSELSPNRLAQGMTVTSRSRSHVCARRSTQDILQQRFVLEFRHTLSLFLVNINFEVGEHTPLPCKIICKTLQLAHSDGDLTTPEGFNESH